MQANKMVLNKIKDMSILNTTPLKVLLFPVSLGFLVLVCDGILLPPKMHCTDYTLYEMIR